MSSSPASAPGNSVLIFLVVLLLLIIRRIYRNYVGVRVSPGRTIGYTAFYFLLGSFLVATSFLEGVPTLYAAPDALFLVLGAYISHRLADRRIEFWKTPDGNVFYKGGILIYVIYLAGLVIRLALEFVLIGPSALTFSTSITPLSQTGVIATTLADMLLTFGIGLLVGRNIRVYQRYRRIVQGKEETREL